MSFVVVGGDLRPSFDIVFNGDIPVTDDEMQRNIKESRGLGLPTFREIRAAPSAKLALVGGGPSIRDHLDTLKSWPGEVWAVNGAWGWCRDNGIDATFIAVDPHPIVAKWCVGATRALICTRCDPSVFEVLKGAQVYTYEINEDGAVRCGSSTATVVPHMAVSCGFYYGTTFFGCESSYEKDLTHAYMREQREQEMAIYCGGQAYLTAPDYYCQAIELSTILREYPEQYREQSGGLLRAMVAQREHNIFWISDGLAKTIRPIQADAA